MSESNGKPGPYATFLLKLRERDLKLREREKKANEELQQLAHSQLKVQGWRFTSDNPGNIWMWEKTMGDGRVLVVDTSTALLFEESLCGEEIPEEIFED